MNRKNVAGRIGGAGTGDEKEGGGFLDTLKENFGRSSTLGQVGKLFTGGGAIIGLRLMAGEVQKMAADARKVADGLRDGSMSGGEAADKLARTIPILGQIYSAGRDIREIFTDEEGAAARITEEAKRINERIDFQQASLREANKLYLEMDDILRGIEKRQAALGLEGTAAAAHSARQQAADEAEAIDKKSREDSLKLWKEYSEQLAKEMKSAGVAVAIGLGDGSDGKLNESIRGAVNRAKSEMDSLRAGTNETYFDTEQNKVVSVNDPAQDEANQKRITQLQAFISTVTGMQKDMTGQLQTIDQKGGAAKLAESKYLSDQLLLIDKNHNKETAALMFESQQKAAASFSPLSIAAMHQAAADMQLKSPLAAIRLNLQADLADISAKMVAGVKEINQKARDEAAKDPQNALTITNIAIDRGNELQAQAIAEAKAKEHEAARALKEKAIAVADHHNEIDAKLRDARLAGLKEEAASGNTLAQIGLKQLAIADDYLKRHKELQAIMRDELATEKQKADAAAEDANLPAEARAAEKLAGTEKRDRNSRHFRAEEAGLLTGVGERDRQQENKADQVAKHTAEINKNMDIAAKALQAINAAIGTAEAILPG